jgi:hypothetical protein
MKPSWDGAPDWANWLSQDGDEKWHWYENQPSWDYPTKQWVTNGRYEEANAVDGNGTLEERP